VRLVKEKWRKELPDMEISSDPPPPPPPPPKKTPKTGGRGERKTPEWKIKAAPPPPHSHLTAK